MVWGPPCPLGPARCPCGQGGRSAGSNIQGSAGPCEGIKADVCWMQHSPWHSPEAGVTPELGRWLLPSVCQLNCPISRGILSLLEVPSQVEKDQHCFRCSCHCIVLGMPLFWDAAGESSDLTQTSTFPLYPRKLCLQ